MKLFRMTAGLAIAAAAALGTAGAQAQSVEEFYRGNTVNMYIGYSAGGGYDTYARLLAEHLGKHIPGNPTVVPQNMPGAGSLRLVNWLYSAAPQDGTAMGMVARAAPWDPLFGNEAAEFDALEFNYIGSMNNEVSVCVARADTGIETVEDLKEQELIVGGTGPTADTVQFPLIMNAVFGTKIEIVDGYPGGNDVNLAMERGEVTGRCGWSWSSVVATRGNWVDEKFINILVQISTAKHPDLPDVPLIMDFAENEEDRQLLTLVFARQVTGRPIFAPPNIPEERVQALREAFMATMQDPDFLADAERLELEITAVSGEEVQRLVEESYDTSPEVVARISEIIGEH
jgi:tripartite-type tricarboxylate transporter receptor subunit TctC